MSLEELRSVGVRYRAPPRFYGFIDLRSGRVISLAEVERRLRKDFWRYSYGFKFVQHGEYAGAIIEAWSIQRSLLERNEVRLGRILRKAVADYLGWGEGDWWFQVVDDGEGYQRVPSEPGLDGTFEWRIEDDDGTAVDSGEGEL